MLSALHFRLDWDAAAANSSFYFAVLRKFCSWFWGKNSLSCSFSFVLQGRPSVIVIIPLFIFFFYSFCLILVFVSVISELLCSSTLGWLFAFFCLFDF